MTSNTISAQHVALQESAPRFSKWFLWTAVLIFTCGALFTSGYMSYGEITATPAMCSNDGFVNCDAVRASVWSELAGIPVAYLGFITYSAIFITLMLERRGIPFFQANGVILIFAMSLFGFLFHCYLTYNSIFTLGKICPWCVATHGFMTFILIFNTIRLVRHFNQPVTQA
ncbi:MAG: vitamin K epoxide reductase family protein [Pleurocapsa minor GSE-CHR-MK-17-07R]|jgi:uncharacterized membrane protein|nr:vitamin K epoxide reductase family protein [Pleurocapsa minor GSE-CHR-MK 17-07R]